MDPLGSCIAFPGDLLAASGCEARGVACKLQHFSFIIGVHV